MNARLLKPLPHMNGVMPAGATLEVRDADLYVAKTIAHGREFLGRVAKHRAELLPDGAFRLRFQSMFFDVESGRTSIKLPAGTILNQEERDVYLTDFGLVKKSDIEVLAKPE